jgi:pilus assembly protein CpaB
MLRALILLIALGAGGGALWIAAQDAEPDAVVVAPTPPPIAMTAVLVAAQDVPRGSEVTAAALVWQDWPADAVPATLIDRSARPDALKELSGQYASRPISVGEPIATGTLSVQSHGYLAATLATGKRAVAINVSAQSTAGGFILPNDRVDVLHTVQRTRDSEGGETRTRTLLRGVRVLAIDQTTEDNDSATVLGKTATLELMESQVEAVTAAQTTGTLSLSLRPLDEIPGDIAIEVDEPTKTIRVRRGNIIEETAIN